MSLLFVGCDIGAWYAKRGDGLAACRWNGHRLDALGALDGRLFHPLVETGQLGSVLKAGIDRGDSIIVAIDAALGWPAALLDMGARQVPRDNLYAIDLREGVFANPYLYRETERYVLARTGKRPLTAVGDRFGNNCSKAQVLAAWVRHILGPSTYCPPFDAWDLSRARKARFTVLEVYPGASLRSKRFSALAWPGQVRPFSQVGGTNVVDAEICAVTGACYAQTIGKFAVRGYPRTVSPSVIEARTLNREGWIFFPTDDG